jgi:hypothetical protein
MTEGGGTRVRARCRHAPRRASFKYIFNGVHRREPAYLALSSLSERALGCALLILQRTTGNRTASRPILSDSSQYIME